MKILLLFLIPASMWAACSGSGTTWTCPAGASSSDIQSAINSGTDPQVITFAAGTYTVTAWVKFAIGHGTTLICASAPPADPPFGTAGGNGPNTGSPCTFNFTNTAFGGDLFCGVDTHFYRISGFVFNGGGGGTGGLGLIWFDDASGCTPSQVHQVRVDHNEFTNVNGGAIAISWGDGGSLGDWAGVNDHNTFINSTQFTPFLGLGDAPTSKIAASQGTINNIFNENNTITFTSMPNASNGGCTDAWGGIGYVNRYNVSLNCLWTAHGATHAGGPKNYEFYKNNLSTDSGAVPSYNHGDELMHLQGSGQMIIFSNRFDHQVGQPESGDPIQYQDYRGTINVDDTASSVSVSGGTTTYTGTFPDLCSNIPYCYVFAHGFTQSGNNGNLHPTAISSTTITVTTTTQINESATCGGGACLVATASIDGGEPFCDGTYTGTFSDGGVDGNRSTTATNRGYPCWHQPGRDFFGVLSPMYVWDNAWVATGNQAAWVFNTSGGTINWETVHIQADRDDFNAVSNTANSSTTSPFNGTTGMGFGVFANRPTTCSNGGTQAADQPGGGVGYFATDVGAQGTLYTCSATNTWTVGYVPYTYPHPLVGGGTQQPASTVTGTVSGKSVVWLDQQ